jgi:hypothetical protein
LVWKVYKFAKFYVYSLLIEHDKSSVWDKDGMIKLASYCNGFKIRDFIEETRSIYDNRVLMTRVNIVCKEGYCKLEMTISETSINEYALKPWYFDVNS